MSMCDECRIGRLQPVTAPFVNEYGGEILVVPDVPAQLCDVCGDLSYDPQFLYLLYRLMDPLTESSLSSASSRWANNRPYEHQPFTTRRSS